MKNNVFSILFGNINKRTNLMPATAQVAPIWEETTIISDRGGFEIAGFTSAGKYRLLSRKTGKIVELGPKQLDKDSLIAHFGIDFYKDCISQSSKPEAGEEPEHMDLADTIRKDCDDFGLADQQETLGPGLYLDGGQLVIHYGNSVYLHSGQAISTIPTLEKVYVAGPGLGFSHDTPCASIPDIQTLEQAFESFGFEQSWAPAASMGWLASAVMGAVIPNSPSIILTAQKGSGKSLWANLQANLLGPMAIIRDGVPTAAQVLHAIEERSVALICDEFEPLKRTKAQIDQLTEVFNSGYTKGTGRSKFTRATGGVLRHFNPPAGVAMCGINLPEMDDALESRSVRLSMVPLNRAGRERNPLLDPMNRQLTVELGSRIRRLLVSRWEVLRDTRAAVHRMLIEIGHTDRFAETHSPLVAGYVALKHEVVPSAEYLDSLLERWTLKQLKTDEQESPSEACLNALLDRKMVIQFTEGDQKVKSHIRVRDAIRLAIRSHASRQERRTLEIQLEMAGVRPVLDPSTDKWCLYVAASQHHVGARQLFMGTAWARGGWKDTLMRLKGAERSQARLAGDSIKVVKVPLPSSVANPEFDDIEDLQAAPVSEMRGAWVE